ncbi:phosphate signaling complex protein PhoU [Magnetospirillum molischianum]|uniref:Phosphate-specific transport system accessory protein PhoU n=1 Tax=Magnetospirillum molischianum DSM 120 TaxID=1150626 RepID=H8FTQ9_MAGML|nr:phosphate signaling complex protein PhoU [Magnetospirillum molischianum]CCG41766.1 Transcriptional repressor for high-affinity phosphate uptake [Magnetospirillum molischianum DSM 120]
MSIGEQHIVKSYDIELGKLGDALARMGGLAEAQLAAAIEALENRDGEQAAEVVGGDARIDSLDAFINEQAIKVLALRAPVADDLRTVVTALKIAGEIERVGDLAANVAKRSLVLNQLPPVAQTRSVSRLGRLSLAMVKDVLDAYLGGDSERALVVRDRDQELDEIHSALFREILTYMMEDPRTITPCSHLLFIAKNLERIGDHATNIAEMTHFRITGKSLPEERIKCDTAASLGGLPGHDTI